MKRNLKPNRINSWSSNAKLSKKIFYTIGLSSILVVPSTLVFTSTLDNQFIQSNSLKDNKRFDDNLSVTIDNPDASAFQSQIKPLVPSYVNYVNRLVSTSVGPIVHYNNELVSLDWFGAKRWSIDTTKYAPNNGNNLDRNWNRAWLNITLDRKNNHILMLTNGSTNATTYRQRLIQIDVINGSILSQNEITNANKIFFNLTFLESGKVMIFDDREKQFTPRYVLFDPSSKEFTIREGNIGNNTMISPPENHPNSYMFFANVIPIANNRNIVMVLNFPNQGTTGDNGFNYATSNIYFILTDDNLNKISTSTFWSKGQLAVNGLQGYRNSKYDLKWIITNC